ncbi:hypothetical protein PTI98_004737 [Pleurotus ostreatus]|nr:hypothetical protein PTI98_004737 [Pleurotus ostreatus]
MDSHQLIDAQFDRAVAIVQALPKTGPIQTDYEEKLEMYSLYKQATVGNVKQPRPGIFDMLGRAKWDAWAKHKDLEPYEAKWLYVEALLKVLRKYSDKTVAQDFVRELESYGGDPSNIVSSRTFSHSHGSESSGSTVSDDVPPSRPYAQPQVISHHPTYPPPGNHPEDFSDADSEGEVDQHAVAPPRLDPGVPQGLPRRPQSSLSSHRYRTPMAGSLAMSPPPIHPAVPETQPLPTYETPSAFASPPHPSTLSSSYAAVSPYAGQFSESSRVGFTSSLQSHPSQSAYRGHTSSVPPRPYGPARPASRLAIESALENVQAHLTALNERLETLESLSFNPSRSRISISPRNSGNISPYGRRTPDDNEDRLEWDVNDMGLWSLILNPLAHGVHQLKNFGRFFIRNEDRSPALIILRRLCLDVSFLLFVLAIVRAIWRKSGVRRREVRAALSMLWHAIIGAKKKRVMVERGV